MDDTMAYQGSESQEIGRSSDLKGKDECRENLSKEPDSSYIKTWFSSIRDIANEVLVEYERRENLSKEPDSSYKKTWFSSIRDITNELLVEYEPRENLSKEPDSSYIKPLFSSIRGNANRVLIEYVRRENLSKEPDCFYIEHWSSTRDIPHQELRELESRTTDYLIWKAKRYYSHQFGGAHCADGQGPLECDIVADGGTGPIGVRVRLPNQGPFKCLIVGGGGTGKTIYVKRKLMGEFEKKYEPTMGMHKHMLEVPTKQGSTQFLCIDTPGHEKPGTLRDLYYEGADCFIIFFDITAKQTQKDVSMWHDDVRRVRGDILTVVCGNKVDLKKRQVKTKKVTFYMKKKLQYYEISAKSGYNLDKPFQYLAEKLAGYVEGANCI